MTEQGRSYSKASAWAKERADLGYGPFDACSRSPRVHRFPDFLIIGAQKAGTTWLFDNIDYHPRVWLSPVKELNYFSELYCRSADGWEARGRSTQSKAAEDYFTGLVDPLPEVKLRAGALKTVRENALTDDWYGRIFAHAPTESVCGEASPEYCVLPREAIVHIASLNPKLVAILVVRDPIARLWSHAKMSIRRGHGELTLKFLRQPEEWRVFFGRSNYAEILRRWWSVLGRDQVLVLNYDWLRESSQLPLRKVCERLGLSYDPGFFPAAASASGEVDDLKIPADIYEFAKAKCAAMYEELVEYLPDIAPRWQAQHYG